MEELASLHPFFVHFPIALFVFYSIIEILGVLLKKESFLKFSLLILISVVVMSILSALTGNQAEALNENLIDLNGELNELIEQHESCATLSIWYFVFLLIFKIYLFVKNKFTSNINYALILLALIGCVLILLTGKLGADLVYKYGLGTDILKLLN